MGTGASNQQAFLRYVSLASLRDKEKMQYCELHARSAFTFLEGASLPEALALACSQRDIPSMALLDRHGVYGAPRFHLAADESKIKAHIGAEVCIAEGGYYPLLVRSQLGYQNLCRLITTAKLRCGKKNVATSSLEELRHYSEGLICLTGDEQGPLAHALNNGGMEAGRELLQQLIFTFGHENVYVELQRHFNRRQ